MTDPVSRNLGNAKADTLTATTVNGTTVNGTTVNGTTVTASTLTGVPRIIGNTFTHTTSNFTTTSSTFVDVTNLTLSITAEVGDILFIDVGFAHNVSATSGIARIIIVDGGTSFNPGPMAGFDESQLSINSRWKNLTCGWTVATAGTVTIKGQVKGAGGNTVTVYGITTASAVTSSTDSSSNIRVLHMRNT